MQADTLGHKVEKDGVAVTKDDLTAISEQIQDTADQIRSLSHALMPKGLHQETLASALGELVQEEGEFSGIACEFIDEAGEVKLDDDVAMNVYRIAREAVVNAREHASPTRVTVELRQEGEALVTVIRDDGVGWDEDGPTEEGLGLHLMRHRANGIGASLSFHREDGETRVECRLPLS